VADQRAARLHFEGLERSSQAISSPSSVATRVTIALIRSVVSSDRRAAGLAKKSAKWSNPKLGSATATQTMRTIGTTKKSPRSSSAGASSSSPTAADGSARQARLPPAAGWVAAMGAVVMAVALGAGSARSRPAGTRPYKDRAQRTKDPEWP
jgi:hypothetical protein